MPSSLRIPALNDMHVHLREFHACRWYALRSAQWSQNLLAMPNLRVPLTGGLRVADYRLACTVPGLRNVIVPFYLTESHTADDVRSLFQSGVSAAKVYPRGLTTHSDAGVLDYTKLYPVLEAMEDVGMVLCLHGEKPGSEVLDAESDFLYDVLDPILENFPRLRVVLEHVTTADAIVFVEDAATDRLAATVTAHHLFLTLDDVIGGGLRPRDYCKPVAKYRADRAALLSAATGDDPRFFLGSDSAPHPRSGKLAECGCAGVYTAPYLPHYLMTAFAASGVSSPEVALADFATHRAARFYGLEDGGRSLLIRPGETRVPEHEWPEGSAHDERSVLMPFKGGETLPWEVIQA